MQDKTRLEAQVTCPGDSVMPSVDQDGLVRTLNKRGWMMTYVDPTCQAFVDFAGQCDLPVIDIGCAYGVHTLAALARGAEVIAVDMDERHLQILRDRTPPAHAARLKTMVGTFPDFDVEDGSIGAALAARIFHFLDGRALEVAAEKIFNMLAPGGRVFVAADTPYLKTLESFLPEYERRRSAGEPFPGLVEDMSLYEPEEVAAGIIPKLMHFLDVEVLTRTFSKAGFEIETAMLFPRVEGFSQFLLLDGREGVALIARKGPMRRSPVAYASLE